MPLVYNQLVKYLEYDKLKKLMGDWMKKLLIITLTLFLVSNSYAEEMSQTIIEKLVQKGQKECKEQSYGEYLLDDYLVTLKDISNDGIKDLIIDTSRQSCEHSSSWFAGGTGGNEFIFFINPTNDIVKSWNPLDYYGGNKEDRIFSFLIRDYYIVPWKDGVALQMQEHGFLCGVSGDIGCYSILTVSEEGFKTVKDSTPNSS